MRFAEPLLARFGMLQPLDTLIAGDQCSKRAGGSACCRLALVSYGYAGGKSLHELGGEIVISSLEALAAILARA